MRNCNRQHLKATATMNCYSTQREVTWQKLENFQMCCPYRHRNAPAMSTSVQKLFFSLWTPLKVSQFHPPDSEDRNYWGSFVHGNQLLEIQILVAGLASCLQHVSSTSKIWGRQKWGSSRDVATNNNLELRLSTWRSKSDVWGTAAVWAMERESRKSEQQTGTTRRLEQKELAQHSARRVSWDETPLDEPEALLHMEHRCVHLAELPSPEQEHLWGMDWSLTPEDI